MKIPVLMSVLSIIALVTPMKLLKILPILALLSLVSCADKTKLSTDSKESKSEKSASSISESPLDAYEAGDKDGIYEETGRKTQQKTKNPVAIDTEVKKTNVQRPKFESLPGQISETDVQGWVVADKAKVAASDQPFIKYVTLSALANKGLSSENDLNTLRFGLSKTVNCNSRYATNIVNPVAVDPYGLVYRLDIRDYWGFTAQGANPQKATEHFATIIAGRNNRNEFSPVGPDGMKPMQGDILEAQQFAHNINHPDTYNSIMDLPEYASQLEDQIALVKDQQERSFKFSTVDDAITIGRRLVHRGDIQVVGKPGGYYWRSTDAFYGQRDDRLFPFYENPIPQYRRGGRSMMAMGQVRTVASEIIFSTPNGCQGYYIAGNADQRRVKAERSFVIDPLRGDNRDSLVNGISCHSCHINGLQAAKSSMNDFIKANPNAFNDLAAVRQYYPDEAGWASLYGKDIQRWVDTMSEMIDGMVASEDEAQIQRMKLGGGKESIYFLSTGGRSSEIQQ